MGPGKEVLTREETGSPRAYLATYDYEGWVEGGVLELWTLKSATYASGEMVNNEYETRIYHVAGGYPANKSNPARALLTRAYRGQPSLPLGERLILEEHDYESPGGGNLDNERVISSKGAYDYIGSISYGDTNPMNADTYAGMVPPSGVVGNITPKGVTTITRGTTASSSLTWDMNHRYAKSTGSCPASAET